VRGDVPRGMWPACNSSARFAVLGQRGKIRLLKINCIFIRDL